MNDTAHKTALHLSSTINDLAGLLDDYVSQLAAEENADEANETLICAIGMLDEKVSKLRQQLREAFALTQRSAK